MAVVDSFDTLLQQYKFALTSKEECSLTEVHPTKPLLVSFSANHEQAVRLLQERVKRLFVDRTGLSQEALRGAEELIEIFKMKSFTKLSCSSLQELTGIQTALHAEIKESFVNTVRKSLCSGGAKILTLCAKVRANPASLSQCKDWQKEIILAYFVFKKEKGVLEQLLMRDIDLELLCHRLSQADSSFVLEVFKGLHTLGEKEPENRKKILKVLALLWQTLPVDLTSLMAETLKKWSSSFDPGEKLYSDISFALFFASHPIAFKPRDGLFYHVLSRKEEECSSKEICDRFLGLPGVVSFLASSGSVVFPPSFNVLEAALWLSVPKDQLSELFTFSLFEQELEKIRPSLHPEAMDRLLFSVFEMNQKHLAVKCYDPPRGEASRIVQEGESLRIRPHEVVHLFDQYAAEAKARGIDREKLENIAQKILLRVPFEGTPDQENVKGLREFYDTIEMALCHSMRLLLEKKQANDILTFLDQVQAFSALEGAEYPVHARAIFTLISHSQEVPQAIPIRKGVAGERLSITPDDIFPLYDIVKKEYGKNEAWEKGLRLLSDRIVHRTAFNGTPPEGSPQLKEYYSIIELYFCHTIRLLRQDLCTEEGSREKAMDKAVSFIKEMSDAAFNCGGRYFSTSLSEYFKASHQGDSPVEKILRSLAEMRKTIFEQTVLKRGETHNANPLNAALRRYGRRFGIPGAADAERYVDPFSNTFYVSNEQELKAAFSEAYTPRSILTWIAAAYSQQEGREIFVDYVKQRRAVAWKEDEYEGLQKQVNDIQSERGKSPEVKQKEVEKFLQKKGIDLMPNESPQQAIIQAQNRNFLEEYVQDSEYAIRPYAWLRLLTDMKVVRCVLQSERSPFQEKTEVHPAQEWLGRSVQRLPGALSEISIKIWRAVRVLFFLFWRCLERAMSA